MKESVPESHSQEAEARKNGLGTQLTKITSQLALEFQNLHPRLIAANLFASLLPPFVGGRLRRIALRAAGIDIGRGTMFWGMPTITGTGKVASRLRIGEACLINMGCIFDVEDKITLGDNVGLGHEVLIITGSHKIGPRSCRAGELATAPVTIESGAWIGSRAIILPGVTIGAGAVIAAGTVVNRSVSADTLISGNQQVSLAKWR